jgi:hypothetical protein
MHPDGPEHGSEGARMREKKLGHALRLAVATVGIVGLLASSPMVASAGERGTVSKGTCSGDSTYQLKLFQDHGVIKVVFGVTQGVTGDLWRVRIGHNRHLMFLDVRVTQDPDGSFTIRRLARNHRGPDFFRAGAKNVSTGETCGARAAI